MSFRTWWNRRQGDRIVVRESFTLNLITLPYNIRQSINMHWLPKIVKQQIRLKQLRLSLLCQCADIGLSGELSIGSESDVVMFLSIISA